MFVGREKELESLKALLRKETASLVACRGRRRIGKSTLFYEFARKNKCDFIVIEGLGPRKGQTNFDQLKNFGERLCARHRRRCSRRRSSRPLGESGSGAGWGGLVPDESPRRRLSTRKRRPRRERPMRDVVSCHYWLDGFLVVMLEKPTGAVFVESGAL